MGYCPYTCKGCGTAKDNGWNEHEHLCDECFEIIKNIRKYDHENHSKNPNKNYTCNYGHDEECEYEEHDDYSFDLLIECEVCENCNKCQCGCHCESRKPLTELQKEKFCKQLIRDFKLEKYFENKEEEEEEENEVKN